MVPPRPAASSTPLDGDRTRLTATTGDPPWFVSMLAETQLPVPDPRRPELRDAAAEAGQRLLDAVAPYAADPGYERGRFFSGS